MWYAIAALVIVALIALERLTRQRKEVEPTPVMKANPKGAGTSYGTSNDHLLNETHSIVRITPSMVLGDPNAVSRAFSEAMVEGTSTPPRKRPLSPEKRLKELQRTFDDAAKMHLKMSCSTKQATKAMQKLAESFKYPRYRK